MGIIADALRLPIRNATPVVVPQHSFDVGGGTPQGSYLQYARQGYAGNEIVFSAIELLATSAGEPHITGRRWRRDSPVRRNRAEVRAAIRTIKNELVAKGTRRPNAAMVRNGFVEEQPGHPVVQLLNKPNPFMSRGQMWGTVVMDMKLAGNAYLVKGRANGFPDSMPVELWRLRPDRVKVIPDPANFISGYEYNTGTEKVTYRPQDVIHFKTRNPLSDYYGLPPLMAIAGRVDIDNYMRGFLRSFFERGGTGPGSILAVKQRLTEEAKEQMQARYTKQFGGANGIHEMMILDNAEATYTQMGLNRGLRDALPKELNALQEARISMVFGVPGSILGLLIGYESSSYANKRADWQVLWDVTMTPLLSDLDDTLNLALVPDFAGIDEVYFDLDDIKALQEDVDAIQERERKNFAAGGISLEEFRDAIGRDPAVSEGTFYIPTNIAPKPFEELTAEPEPAAPPMIAPPAEQPPVQPTIAMVEARCRHCDRLLGRDVVAARFDCPRCKSETVIADGVLTA